MTEYRAAGVDLPTFVRQNAPLTPHKAASFAANLAEQLADWHAEGRACGRLHASVRVETVRGLAQPVLVGPGDEPGGYGGPVAADDVHQLGVLLLGLLGLGFAPEQGLPPRPAAVPEPLWSLIAGCLDANPAARPVTAVLAQQLRGLARDLLLGVSPWPTMTGPSNMDDMGRPTGGESPSTGEESEFPTPAFVPSEAATSGPPAPAEPARRGRRVLLAAAVAVVVFGAIGLVFTFVRSAFVTDSPTHTAADATATATEEPTASDGATVAPPLAPTVPPTNAAPASPRSGGTTPRPSTTRPRTTAPPPAPAPGPTSICLPGGCAAQATFHSSNNQLTVCDKKADNHAAVAFYTVGGSGQQKVWASGASGSCDSKTVSIAEGAKITYKVCLGDQSENRVDQCSAEVTNTA